MKRDSPTRFRDMRSFALESMNLAEGLDFEGFMKDRKSQLSILKCVETIGEAAVGISPEYQQSHPEIPWKEIIGMRNRLIHEYWDIDWREVWGVATLDAPELAAYIEAQGASTNDEGSIE